MNENSWHPPQKNKLSMTLAAKWLYCTNSRSGKLQDIVHAKLICGQDFVTLTCALRGPGYDDMTNQFVCICCKINVFKET